MGNPVYVCPLQGRTALLLIPPFSGITSELQCGPPHPRSVHPQPKNAATYAPRRSKDSSLGLEELGTGLVIIYVWIAPVCPANGRRQTIDKHKIHQTYHPNFEDHSSLSRSVSSASRASERASSRANSASESLLKNGRASASLSPLLFNSPDA